MRKPGGGGLIRQSHGPATPGEADPLSEFVYLAGMPDLGMQAAGA